MEVTGSFPGHVCQVHVKLKALSRHGHCGCKRRHRLCLQGTENGISGITTVTFADVNTEVPGTERMMSPNHQSNNEKFSFCYLCFVSEKAEVWVCGRVGV